MIPKPPILVIKRGFSFYVVASLDDLSCCTSQAYREGFYEDMLLYDASGGLWLVLNASPVQRLSFLDKLLPWRRIRVRLYLGERTDGNLTEVVAWLCQILNEDNNFDYYDGPSYKELEDKFKEARNPSEIIRAANLIGS